MALLIPYAGGAEKIVVTVLTMIIGPLYIPSVWGVFSKRLTQKHLLTAMIITYACGIFGLAFKFSPAVRASFEWINPNVLESVIGTVVPAALLAVMELVAKIKGTTDPGYDRVQAIVDPDADVEPSTEMKRATKHYSHMAITCFVITLAAIALLLVQQLVMESYDAAVERIMVGGVVVMVGIAVAYCIYRYIDSKKNADN